MELYTALRLVSLALGALLVAGILPVIRLHAIATRRAPSGSGLLPWHVTAVATGTLLLAASGLAGIFASLGELVLPLEVRFALYIAGTSLTLVSLVIISRGSRRRVRQHEAAIRITPVSLAGDRHAWRRGRRRPPRARDEP